MNSGIVYIIFSFCFIIFALTFFIIGISKNRDIMLFEKSKRHGIGEVVGCHQYGNYMYLDIKILDLKNDQIYRCQVQNNVWNYSEGTQIPIVYGIFDETMEVYIENDEPQASANLMIRLSYGFLVAAMLILGLGLYHIIV